MIRVSDDDPPKVQVGIIKSAASAKATPASQPPAAAVTPAATTAVNLDATIDAALVARSPEATQPALAVAASAVAAIDATVAPESDLTAAASVLAADATVAGDLTAAPISVAARSGGTVRASATARASGASRAGATVRSGASAASAKRPGASTDLSLGDPAVKADLDVPERLGGYRILRLLGRGAMGAVYEARQLSLDRTVALKTIRGRLADSPAALARFTREAYAAAQLTHHNVVQIYDFGQDHGQHFFSMEWVRGGPLSDLVRNQGPIEPRLAATYTLQAARGLQFAHRSGMVHRDVKPANLLVDEEGVVKVADLGLVKVPDQPDPESDVAAASASSGGTQVTMMGTAVGTPAYMAPEQAVDATLVDHRADIYSLGCTLYFLIAGKPPFDGSQVTEVMRQHAEAPPPDPCALGPHVSRPLADIIVRSMSKDPQQRYSTTSEMIRDLEAYLGVDAAGALTPEQADRWEELANQFASVPLAKTSRAALPALLGLTLLALLVSLLLGARWLLLAPAILLAAPAAAVLLGARGEQGPLLLRLRQWLASLPWSDRILALAIGVITLVATGLLGMLPALLVGAMIGAGIGAGYHFLLLIKLRESRRAIFEEAQRLVRDTRISGVDEDQLRTFVGRYAGKHWRPLFEALFGYDAVLAMREALLADPASRNTAGGLTLRDRLCTALAARAETNRKARDHAQLAKLEEQGLRSEGISGQEAKERAWQMAAALMDAAKIDAAARQSAAASAAASPAEQAEARRQRMKAMMAEARSGKYSKRRDRLAPLRLLLGVRMRLLAGIVLLGAFAWWAHQNQVFESVRQSVSAGQLDLETAKQIGIQSAQRTTAPLWGTSGWAFGFAGLILIGSSLVSGWRMSLFALPAAGVALFGSALGIPAVGPLEPWMTSSAAALVLLVPGVFLGDPEH